MIEEIEIKSKGIENLNVTINKLELIDFREN